MIKYFDKSTSTICNYTYHTLLDTDCEGAVMSWESVDVYDCDCPPCDIGCSNYLMSGKEYRDDTSGDCEGDPDSSFDFRLFPYSNCFVPDGKRYGSKLQYCSSELDQQIFYNDSTCGGSVSETLGLDGGCNYISSFDIATNITIVNQYIGEEDTCDSSQSTRLRLNCLEFIGLIIWCLRIVTQ